MQQLLLFKLHCAQNHLHCLLNIILFSLLKVNPFILYYIIQKSMFEVDQKS